MTNTRESQPPVEPGMQVRLYGPAKSPMFHGDIGTVMGSTSPCGHPMVQLDTGGHQALVPQLWYEIVRQ